MKKTLLTIVLITTLLFSAGLVLADNDSVAKDNDEDFSSAYKRFENNQKSFQEARDQYQNDKREDAKNKYIERSQKILENSIDVLVKRNVQLKKQIEKKIEIYGDLGQEIKDMLDSDNQKLNVYSTEIINASTTQSLGQAAGEIKNYRLQQQSYLRKIIILAHISQYEKTVIKTAQTRSDNLTEKISAIKSQGKNVSELEALLSQANAKIEQARNFLDDARDELKEEEIDATALSSVEKYLNDSQQSIKDAYGLFKQIAINGNELYSNKTETETPTITDVSNSAATSTATATSSTQ
jgi:hypothetical protein